MSEQQRQRYEYSILSHVADANLIRVVDKDVATTDPAIASKSIVADVEVYHRPDGRLRVTVSPAGAPVAINLVIDPVVGMVNVLDAKQVRTLLNVTP